MKENNIWHCEERGYIQNAWYPNTPAIDTWKTDDPRGYHLNVDNDEQR